MKEHYSDQHYVDDSVLLDGLYEFHPGFFSELEPEERQVLRRYYLTGEEEIPEDVVKYRQQLVAEEPEIEAKAREAFEKMCRLAGMSDD